MSIVITETSHDGRWTETFCYDIEDDSADGTTAIDMDMESGMFFAVTRLVVTITGASESDLDSLFVEAEGLTIAEVAASARYRIFLRDGWDTVTESAPAWLKAVLHARLNPMYSEFTKESWKAC